MAVETITVGTLVSRVMFHLGNTATASTTMANEIKFALGYTLRMMVRTARPNAFIVEGTISATSGGGATYSLADDVYEVVYPSMRHDSSPYEPVRHMTQQQLDESSVRLIQTGTGRPAVYVMPKRHATTGLWQVTFYPAPDASYTIKYAYHALPTLIDSSTSDNTNLDVRFPRDLTDGLVYGAATRFPQYLGADQLIAATKFFQEALRDMHQSGNGTDGAYYQRQSYRGGRGPRDMDWPTDIYTGSPVR